MIKKQKCSTELTFVTRNNYETRSQAKVFQKNVTIIVWNENPNNKYVEIFNTIPEDIVNSIKLFHQKYICKKIFSLNFLTILIIFYIYVTLCYYYICNPRNSFSIFMENLYIVHVSYFLFLFRVQTEFSKT